VHPHVGGVLVGVDGDEPPEVVGEVVDIHSIKCIEALENIQEPFIKKLYDALDADEKLLTQDSYTLS